MVTSIRNNVYNMFRIDADVLNYFTTKLLRELLFCCILIVCTDVPY